MNFFLCIIINIPGVVYQQSDLSHFLTLDHLNKLIHKLLGNALDGKLVIFLECLKIYQAEILTQGT